MLCSTKPSCLRRRSPHQGAGEADEDLGRAMARRERGDLGVVSDGPDRLKVEFAVATRCDGLVPGHTWWSWSLSQGARTNEGRKNAGHGKGPGEVLVSPARAARVLSFELLGALTFLARPAFLLRARPFSRATSTCMPSAGVLTSTSSWSTPNEFLAAGRSKPRRHALQGPGDDRSKHRWRHPKESFHAHST